MSLPTYHQLLINEGYRWRPTMTYCDDEPFEVSVLKKHLANLSCKCSVCEKRSISLSPLEEYRQTNKEVQEELPIYSTNRLVDKDYNPLNANVDFLCNNVSCAGCYIALNLLKTKEIKVYKDEETETKAGLSCCDKSIGKCVRFVERTTSTSSVTKPEFTISSVCDNNVNVLGIMKKRSNEHVSFSDDYDIRNQDVQAFHMNCFCLQNFIDSLRPPLDNS